MFWTIAEYKICRMVFVNTIYTKRTVCKTSSRYWGLCWGSVRSRGLGSCVPWCCNSPLISIFRAFVYDKFIYFKQMRSFFRLNTWGFALRGAFWYQTTAKIPLCSWKAFIGREVFLWEILGFERNCQNDYRFLYLTQTHPVDSTNPNKLRGRSASNIMSALATEVEDNRMEARQENKSDCKQEFLNQVFGNVGYHIRGNLWRIFEEENYLIISLILGLVKIITAL